MTRTPLNPHLWLGLLLGLLLCGCGEEERPSARHLLIISVDTLRVDRLGCYGGRLKTSPAIDRLAKEGTRFESAFSTSSSTLPAVTTLMTGKYPSEHGVIANRFFPIPDAEDFLAERLTGSGFASAAFVANQLLSPGSKIGQGFDVHQAYDPYNVNNGVHAEETMTADAARWLREHFEADSRAFLWVHYMQPHAPYIPPRDTAGRFVDPSYRGDIDGGRDTLNEIFIEKRELEDADLAHILDLYDASVRYVDDQIDRLLTELRVSGELDNTLVVFVADHGEDLYDHNKYFYHANSVYRSSLQVPLIFRWPGGVPGGQTVSGLASSVDLRSTTLRLLGLERDPGGDGQDLSPAWSSDLGALRELAFAQFEEDIVTVFSDRWTYIDNPNEITPRHVPVEGEYPVERCELYDRSADRDEQRNVCGDNAPIVSRMEESIASWRSKLREPGEQVSDLRTRSELEQLRRLGYTGKASTRKKRDPDSENDEGEK